MTAILKAGGIGSLNLAMKTLYDEFETNSEFNAVRQSMFPLALASFRETLAVWKKNQTVVEVPQKKEVLPEITPVPTQEVPKQTLKVIFFPCLKTRQWSRGGTGSKRHLPAYF